MKFSIIYPTRHRPKFIEVALEFLEHQGYSDFEVIISDNYTDPSLSCESYCQKSSLKNIKYVRPPSPLSMVDNWNYALQHATGDYVCYFTDKMFLLPGVLAYSADILQECPAEILSWVDSKFSPLQFPKYFDEGIYVRGTPGTAPNERFEEFDPKEELSKKVFAAVSRREQTASHYARGKICFGAYDRHLITRILSHTDRLFHNVSPDYTSMILGLSYAHSAIEIGKPGIVHINTDLSNGGQGAIRDELALSYLQSLDEQNLVFEEMLIPNLYVSTHNVVARDYVSFQRKFGFNYELNLVNWLVYITEDFNLPGRIWSTPQIEFEQKKLLENFIHERLNQFEQEQYFSTLKLRSSAVKKAGIRSATNNFLKKIAPEFFLKIRRKYKPVEKCPIPASEQLRLRDILAFRQH